MPTDEPRDELEARSREIVRRLEEAYPGATCALDHENALQLLVATILSAQCTDARVNKVTPALFARYPAADDFASAERSELEELVRTTGFFRNKAKSIQGAAETMVREFGGEVPQTMEELLTLPGVARKTANVVLGTAFKKAVGVVVDTHVNRLSHRMGFAKAKTPEQVEQQLMDLVPRGKWIAIAHLLILHGRAVCTARSPKCDGCVVEDQCPKIGVPEAKAKGPDDGASPRPPLAERIAASKRRVKK